MKFEAELEEEPKLLTEFPKTPVKDDKVLKDNFLHTFDGREWGKQRAGGYRTGRVFKVKAR